MTNKLGLRDLLVALRMAWDLGQEVHGQHRPWLHTIACYEADNAPNGWWCSTVCQQLRAALEEVNKV